ncbi:MAG: hypothetical protein OEZ01_16680 [Candidatus Heimdallarchaeota archaeon]|nr:hypothetical protein [Candidatus Heimdallarchaeota archaeon]MDH5647649.1 hypothetical protein [Candidatus Heimdallarchaeota archaeon]
MNEVVIPIRGICSSMKRLRLHLSNDVVDEIVDALFQKAIKVVLDNSFIPIVVTADTLLASKLADQEIIVYTDDGNSLNKAILDVIKNRRLTELFLVMPDLPGINNQNFKKILYLKDLYENIIVPTTDLGTAITSIPSKILTQPVFGPNSSEKIKGLLDNSGHFYSIYHCQSLENDLDTIHDWAYWKETIKLERSTKS